MTKNKSTAIGFLAAALVALVAIAMKSWFSMRHDSGGVGLLGVEQCFGGKCEGMSWFAVKRAPGDVQLPAFLGLAAVGAAIGLAIHAGVMLLRDMPERVKVNAFTPVVWIAAAAATLFFMRLELGEISHKVTVSWGFFACIAGLAGIFLARK